MKRQLRVQERGHRRWFIVRLFYVAMNRFRQQYEQYEDKVVTLATALGLKREKLRLTPSELAGLLDFKELERLRDDYIFELKDLCHLVFRTPNRTDPLDSYVSDIFHEISILKEEHYNVKTYAPVYERDAAKVELQYILDEAHTMFPQKVSHIWHLFGKARKRMEQQLPSFRSMPVVIRSLYLHRDGFVREAYPDGIVAFYRFMYDGEAFEGYYRAGVSFYQAGFFAKAREAFELAEASYANSLLAVTEKRKKGEMPQEGGRAMAGMLRSMRAKVKRMTTAQEGIPDGGLKEGAGVQ